MDSEEPAQETDSLLGRNSSSSALEELDGRSSLSKQVVWAPQTAPDSLYERLFWWSPTKLPAWIVVQRCWLLSWSALLWSTGPAITKSVLMEGATPVAINQWRFFFSTLTLFAWTPGVGTKDCLEHPDQLKGSKEISKRDKWWLGMQLGFWQFLSYTFAAVGLQYTTAVHACFLLHLHVKVLPFLSYLLYGRRITFVSWFSTLGAVLGVALLTTNASQTQTYGDIWCMAAAFSRGIHILTLEHAQKSANGMELTSASFWISCVVNILSMILSRRHISVLFYPLQTSWKSLVFLALFATAFVTPILTWGKRSIPVKEWALIHVFDTLFGALFAMWFVDETMTITGWIGAVAIIFAVFIQQKDAAKKGESLREKPKKLDDAKINLHTKQQTKNMV